MSTSPKLARKNSGSSGALGNAHFEPFPYDSLMDTAIDQTLQDIGRSSSASEKPASHADNSSLVQAHSDGLQKGRAEAQKVFDEQLNKQRDNIAVCITQFAQDRDRYFKTVETEVVQLALSIARKVLQRESQLDPLLLAGVVRFALEKIEGATQISLHVHPSHKADWEKYFQTSGGGDNKATIVEDPSLAADACLLQTSLGTVQLGIDAQLREIEQVLTDLVSARPGKPV